MQKTFVITLKNKFTIRITNNSHNHSDHAIISDSTLPIDRKGLVSIPRRLVVNDTNNLTATNKGGNNLGSLLYEINGGSYIVLKSSA